MKNYQWLLFDADNTLFDFDRSMQQALQDTLEATGVTFDQSFHATYETINTQCWSDFEHGKISKAELRTWRFSLFFEAIRVELDADQFATEYLYLLSQMTFLIEGADVLLESLHSEFRLGLVTNGLKEVQRPRLAKSGIQDYFEVIVVSDEIGHAKPHAGFFDYAFQEMRQPDKSEVMIIGDNLNADIRGGLEYGIDACWYNPKLAARENGIEPTYEISKLEAIRGVV